MAKYCSQCGKELAEGQVFCTECGTPAPKEDLQSIKIGTYTYESAPVQPSNPAPQPAVTSDSKASKKTNVSTGYFFWMKFLYAIPVLGWIICLIMIFSEKEPSKKHFAIATFIWIIIGVILAFLLYSFLHWLFSVAMNDYLSKMDTYLRDMYSIN